MVKIFHPPYLKQLFWVVGNPFLGVFFPLFLGVEVLEGPHFCPELWVAPRLRRSVVDSWSFVRGLGSPKAERAECLGGRYQELLFKILINVL